MWLNQAYFDMRAAELSYENHFYEWTCFQSEQCVEKCLKAVLVNHGYRPPKIHSISILMSISNKINPKFRDTKFIFRQIESFTFVSRYPFLIPGENTSPHEYITQEDAKTCIDEAKELLWKIKELLSDNSYIEK